MIAFGKFRVMIASGKFRVWGFACSQRCHPEEASDEGSWVMEEAKETILNGIVICDFADADLMEDRNTARMFLQRSLDLRSG